MDKITPSLPQSFVLDDSISRQQSDNAISIQQIVTTVVSSSESPC